ncbi:MAG TPA: toll/interleukin-1 receptor domain-containing protein [Burkholderiaceae bacterium]|nr:toll/interleukin-1 receptor domain-containing protein [Burkholderiaceae bacterium]
MASDIFLSYSRADQQLADQFVKIACERGLSVWYDQMIEGGDDWRSKIVDAVSSAKALVILFSDHSNGSRQLIKELAIADSFQKLVIPVLIANCQPRGAYLYELAARNWVNLHPDPSTRLAPLIENLLKEIGSGDSGSSSAPARANHEHVSPPTSSTQGRPSMVAHVASSTQSARARSGDESWFPLKRYDLYVLVPILAAGFLLGIFGEGDNKSGGLGLSAIAFFSYMLVIAVRNARLNRSILSGKSFASYFAVLAIGSAPALVIEGTTASNVTTFLGLLVISLILAVAANVLQVILRKVFQQKLFRSKIEEPLEARAP